MSTIELTSAQQRLIGDSQHAVVIDPATKKQYVLVPAEEYDLIRETIDEEKHRVAIERVAVRNAAARVNEP